MYRILVLVAALAAFVTSGPASATDSTPPTPAERWQADPTAAFEASEITLDDFRWVARPVVVFGDSPNDPRFVQQIELLAARADELVKRDVVVVTDTNTAEMSELRRTLRPRGFMMVLIGKDGVVYLRKPFPWDVRELSRSIDKMPLRQQEERDRRGG